MRRFVLALALAACGGARAPARPAADGVRAYLSALASGDPRAAYALLSADARKQVSLDEFARQWQQTEAERTWQREALQQALQGKPDVGEHALVALSDGKRVSLEREGTSWRLESELVSRTRARRPRDAIRLFADAIAARDVSGALGLLSQRRQLGLTRKVEGFLAGLVRHVNAPLDELRDRAELRWDENGFRYRVVLRKEDEEWRVDDIHIRPSPASDGADPDAAESVSPDDF